MSEGQVNEGSTETTQEQKDVTKNEIAGLNRKNSELTAMLSEQKTMLDSLIAEREALKQEKNATMTESEKKGQELQSLIGEVGTLTTELATIKQEKQENELKAYKLQKLGEAGLNTTFSEFLGGESIEVIDTQIEKLKTTLSNEQQDLKSKMMNQSSPKSGEKDSGDMTKEKFKSLSYSEQSRLYKDNPEKYGSFI